MICVEFTARARQKILSSYNSRMATRIEDYALIGDCHTAALVGRDGSIDWLCLPRFDSSACFAALLGTAENGRWLISPSGKIGHVRRRYRPNTLILETEFETDDGSFTLIDFMLPRQREPNLVRIVKGQVGRVPIRTELTIRFDYGSIVPWVRSTPTGIQAIAGPDSVYIDSAVNLRGENLHTVGEFDIAAGEQKCFVMSWHPSNEEARGTQRSAVFVRRNRALVGRVGIALQLPGAASGVGITFTHHAQSIDLRTDRRNCGGAHHVVARIHRRRAQLGLSFLLAARRHFHAVRADARRFHRRSSRLARLAAPCGGRQSIAIEHSLRTGRRATPDRNRIALAGRVREFETGANWQCRVEPVSARCVRRNLRLAPRGPADASAARRKRVGGRARTRRIPRTTLARSGRRHLGSARPATTLCAFKGHGLGGIRPVGENHRALRRRRAARSLAKTCAKKSTAKFASAGSIQNRTHSCSRTIPTS